jgi:hypothetical protein
MAQPPQAQTQQTAPTTLTATSVSQPAPTKVSFANLFKDHKDKQKQIQTDNGMNNSEYYTQYFARNIFDLFDAVKYKIDY